MAGSHDPSLMRPARRYAEALFALAREKGQAADVGADLAAVRGILEGDAVAKRAIRDPKMSRLERKAAIEQKVLPGRHRLVTGLVQVLLARRREELLHAVPDRFHADRRERALAPRAARKKDALGQRLTRRPEAGRKRDTRWASIRARSRRSSSARSRASRAAWRSTASGRSSPWETASR